MILLQNHQVLAECFDVIRDEADFDYDGHIELLRSLIDFGRGPITIAFQSFKKNFGLFREEDFNNAIQEMVDVLSDLHDLGKLHNLEGDIPFEVSKQDNGDWRISLNAEIPRVELPEVMPSSLPADEVLPLYSGCLTVQESDINIVRELPYDTAEVTLGNEQQKYFFKHVNRKPKGPTLKEVSALASLSHPHIVPLHALALDGAGDIVGLLFPFAARGSLKESVNILAPNAQKLRWVHDVVIALQYMVACGWTYTDIKAANIVVFDDGLARLTDFDGGRTPGHFEWVLDCFGLGVLLEDLKCEGEGLDELVRLAKTTKMQLDDFERMLSAVIGKII